jgi:hypothetical protein
VNDATLGASLRRRSRAANDGVSTHDFLATIDEYLDEDQAEWGREARLAWAAWNRSLWAGLQLARDPDAWAALVHGEDVPRHRLESEWLRRLGL